MKTFTCLYNSPLGNLIISVDENKKLKNINWNFNNKIPNDIDIKYFKDIFQQLDEYFTKKRKTFDLEVNLDNLTSFSKTVLYKLKEIPYGEIITYKKLGDLSGYPRAARAIGTVMRKNPIPIIIPCHRVINTQKIKKNGISPGKYAGGSDKKRYLLLLEGNKIILKQ